MNTFFVLLSDSKEVPFLQWELKTSVLMVFIMLIGLLIMHCFVVLRIISKASKEKDREVARLAIELELCHTEKQMFKTRYLLFKGFANNAYIFCKEAAEISETRQDDKASEVINTAYEEFKHICETKNL